MTTTADRLRLLHGTDAPATPMRALRAGPVEVMLDGIDLRYARIGGTELLRRVYTAVRDTGWGTVPPVVSNLRVEQDDAGFRVEFDCRHTQESLDFSWHGMIVGHESGRLEYVFDGRAERDVAYNRIGICLHHPWRETAGARFMARTSEGELEGVFPDLIGQQLFLDGTFNALFPAFDRLQVELAGGGALVLEFEGDRWETEDHRNWTDANFKTYSTPLALGPPAPLRAGETLRQRVVMTPVDVHGADASPGSLRLSVGEPTGTTFPSIGLGADRDRRRPDEHEAAALAALAPRHLRVDLRLDRDDWRTTLASAQETAGRIGAALELALMLRDERVQSLGAVAEALGSGPDVERVLVTVAKAGPTVPEQTTPAALVDRVRRTLESAVPRASFVGGTEMYFGELNRQRPDPAAWDGVCYSITPQIHAFADVDLVENLDAQAETVRGARVIGGDRPVVVSPITLAPRTNFYAADPDAQPATPPGELPPSVDVRQSSLFGAAWTVGSLKYVAEAGATGVTYYECTGWRGVLERSDGEVLPDRFRSSPGHAFPLYHPLADACEWSGAEVLACSSTDPLRVVGLALRSADGALHLLVANLTSLPLDVTVDGISGSVGLRRLDEETADRAGADPAAFRDGSERIESDGALGLTLEPHAVVRLDAAG
jgi:D-apionolactonase